MNYKFNKRFSNLLKRDWIRKDEGKLTYLQLFGFLLITICVIYFASFLLPNGIADFLPFLKLDEHPESSEISIAFFTIMSGVAFAFPEILKGPTKKVSTMRIIVFMVANVICMLLLKMGWDKHSLTEIGLDGFWIGVIAFLFGAKAAQAYFDISQFAIAQLAKEQYEGRLYSKFLNIQSVSDTLKEGQSCLTIYVSDGIIKDIPSFVYAQLNEIWKIKVQTEIIPNSFAAITHIGQATDELSDSNNEQGFGSICCLVDSTDNPSLKFIVTAGHNFTKGDFKSLGGFIFDNDQSNVLINSAVKGKLFYQRMHFTQDLAIVLMTDTNSLMKNYISFKDGFYELSAKDIKTDTQNVTIASRINELRTGSNIRNAFILDHNIPFDIMYNGEKRRLQNVILIGDSNDPQKSKEISMRGDSGSCVFHKEKDSNKLIGILIGGNGQFSFVLPIKEILESNNFKLL